MLYNVFLSTRDPPNLLHFVMTPEELRERVGVCVDHQGNHSGYFVWADSREYFGWQVIAIPSDDFLQIRRDGEWESHRECEQVDVKTWKP